MISADRMKSVRIAPETIVASASPPWSAAGTSWSWSSWRRAWMTLWAPSYARKQPPNIRMISTTVGATSLSTSATGRMKSSLLRSEPTAIRLMMGSSRSAARPRTYAGVTAASSTTTPAAFMLARPAAIPTSSTEAANSLASDATSSSSPTSPPAMPPSSHAQAVPLVPPVRSRLLDDVTIVRRRLIASTVRRAASSTCTRGGGGGSSPP